MTIKQKNSATPELDLSGFHHDYNLELEDQVKPYYQSGSSAGINVKDVYVSYNQNQFPVFKTFFSHMLTREQVIEALLESLRDIQGYEDQGKNMLIRGKALIVRPKKPAEHVIIDTIVNKQTNDIITFYPETPTSKEEIRQKLADLKRHFKQYIFDPEHRPKRQPVTKEEIEQLVQPYADGIQVNWVMFGDYLLFKEEFSKKALSRPDLPQNQPRKYIKKVIINSKSLENIFSEANDVTFPGDVSRPQIVKKIKMALESVTIYDNRDGRDGPLRYKGIKAPGYTSPSHVIELKVNIDGKNKGDVWELLMYINEDTGELEFAYPLLHS
jgi:hypothetical protein